MYSVPFDVLYRMFRGICGIVMNISVTGIPIIREIIMASMVFFLALFLLLFV